MAGALIVTAEIGRAELARLDALRRAHYPAGRNLVPAHLTMFHALPPSIEEEVRGALARHTGAPAPMAMLGGLIDLDGGVAFAVESPDLIALRDELAVCFHGCLTAQDEAGWRPHVTIQNKVPAKQARALLNRLRSEFQPRPLPIAGLALHRYLGGPWQSLGRWHFRG